MNKTERDQHFDDAMRGLHRASLAKLTPPVHWKLRPAESTTPARRPWLRDWRVGVAFAGVSAALFALAIGLGLRDPAMPAMPADNTMLSASDDADAGVYDQDPDFYAWLASDDADLVAME